MREILFRGKVKNTNEWQYGDLRHWTKKSLGIHHQELHTTLKVIPDTVGQYTGLTDKNGKKIFEGDLIKYANNLYQIIFECGCFALLDKDGEMISKIGGLNDHCYPLMNLYIECCWEDNWAYDIEIIGNIHDNPELLKEG